MIRAMSVRRSLCAGAAVVALTLTSCTGGAPNAAPQGPKSTMGPILQVYRGASGQFVENYNPLSPTVVADVNGLIYERLFFFDNTAPLDAPPTPELGKSYQFDKAGTVMTVTLQDGVTWSDGQSFTADDVAYTFNTMRATPALNTTGNSPKAKANGKNKIILTFDSPAFADAPTLLGSPIVAQHIFAKMKDVTTDPNKNPVGTGPMKLKSFTAQSYVFEKSDSFRAADQVHAPGLRYFSLSGNEAATNKLVAGNLDWAGIFIPKVDQVLKPFPDLHFQPITDQQVVLTTCSNPKLGCTGPQTSSAVRQAMAAAIDRTQVNQLAYFGRGIPISPTFALPKRDAKLIAPQFSPEPMQSDVAKAKSLLEGDGWKLGADGIYTKGGKRLSMTVIVTSGYTDYISALDIMKQQLQKAGIEINPQQQANAEIISARALGKFQVAIDGIFQGPVGDPYYIYKNNFDSKNTGPVGESSNPYGNVARFSNPAVDAAIRVAAGTQDTAVKAAQYFKIQKIIVPDLPYVPVINNQGFGIYSTANYTGWKLYNGGVEETLLRLMAK